MQCYKPKKKKGGKTDVETPYIHATELKVKDENDNDINLDDLKVKIMQRPDNLLKQNEKIAKSGGRLYQFYNITLPAYKGLWYDERENAWKFVTTCPNAGQCKLFCYARKGGYVMFPASFLNSARTISFLMNDWKGFKAKLISEINEEYIKYSKKHTTLVIRWHDSGDFFNEKYLNMAFDVAKSLPNVIFYAYTKSVTMVKALADKPKNFVFNYSFGGKEDEYIKPEDKVSVVVPKQLWNDLAVLGKKPVLDKKGNQKMDKGEPVFQKTIEFPPENLKTFKERLKQKYNLDSVDNIILYKDLLNIPYNPNDLTVTPKYHVIVKTGDGDDAASQKNVLTTMLLIH